MNNLFNFKRMGLLLRADWMESQRKVTYTVGTLLTCFVLYVLFAHYVIESHTQGVTFYSLSTMWLFLYFCQYVNKKIHAQSGSYLFLPANNEEKFATLVLEWILLLASYTVLFVLLLALLNLIAGYQDWYQMGLWENTNRYSMTGLSVFISSLVFLSYLTFRKYPLLMLALGFLAFILAAISLFYTVTQIFGIETFNTQSSYFDHILHLLKSYSSPALFACTGVSLYISYLKLKEKELK